MTGFVLHSHSTHTRIFMILNHKNLLISREMLSCGPPSELSFSFLVSLDLTCIACCKRRQE